MKKRIRVNGIIIFLASVMLVCFPRYFLRYDSSGMFDLPFELAGFIIILLGQLLRVSARGFKSEYSDSGKSLIQNGPYLMVRNPMYLGIILIGFGVVLELFKLWVILIFITFFIIRYVLLIRNEEKKLSGSFPQEYPEYCKKVPRLFPSFLFFFRHGISEYLPMKTAWIKKEVWPIVLVISGVLVFESLEDIKTAGLEGYSREVFSNFLIIILFACFVVYLQRQTIKVGKHGSAKS